MTIQITSRFQRTGWEKGIILVFKQTSLGECRKASAQVNSRSSRGSFRPDGWAGYLIAAVKVGVPAAPVAPLRGRSCLQSPEGDGLGAWTEPGTLACRGTGCLLFRLEDGPSSSVLGAGLFAKGVSLLLEYWDIKLSIARFQSATHFFLCFGINLMQIPKFHFFQSLIHSGADCVLTTIGKSPLNLPVAMPTE